VPPSYLHWKGAAVFNINGHNVVADLNAFVEGLRSDKHIGHDQGESEAYLGRPQSLFAREYSPLVLRKYEAMLAPSASVRVARANGFVSRDKRSGADKGQGGTGGHVEILAKNLHTVVLMDSLLQ
jgi:hypothetical protein